MEQTIDRSQALLELEKGLLDAKKVLSDRGSIDHLFLKLKRKLREYRRLVEQVEDLPVLIDLMKSYINNTYTTISTESVTKIVSALNYLVKSMDLIADFIPVIGLQDDIAVLNACLESVEIEVAEFKCWRKENKETE